MANVVNILNQGTAIDINGTWLAQGAIATFDLDVAEVKDDVSRHHDQLIIYGVSKTYVDVAVAGAGGSGYIAHDTDNTQANYNLVAGWTTVTGLQLALTGNGADDMEVELYIPTFQAIVPGQNINYYLAIVDTDVGPNESIIQAEFNHDGNNGNPIKTDHHIKAIVPAFIGQKTIVPKAWSNTNITATIGGTGEAAGAASLTAKFLA